MAHVDDYRNANTKFEWKAAVGSYAEITGCTAKTVPSADAVTDEVTDLQSECVVQENQIPDYGTLELDVLYKDDDTVHLAIEAVAGLPAGNGNSVQMTLPSGVKVVYVGNVQSFKDQNGTPKNRQRRKFIMHCNEAPVATPAPA